MPKQSLLKNSIIWLIAGDDELVYTFVKGISPKVNVITRLEFELANYDVVPRHVNHYITRTFCS